MNNIFEDWKIQISERIMNCRDLEKLKKALSDELYGLKEYMDDSREVYEQPKGEKGE